VIINSFIAKLYDDLETRVFGEHLVLDLCSVGLLHLCVYPILVWGLSRCCAWAASPLIGAELTVYYYITLTITLR
jgi:hypothetical protein